MKAGVPDHTQHRPEIDGHMAQPKTCGSPSGRLHIQSARKDQVQMLAVPKAQFRSGTYLPRNHPPRWKQGVEASVSTERVSLQANPCAGSRDGVATLSDRAVLNSHGCLRPAIVIDTSQMQGSGGYTKAPHPWLVVHTSGRVCSVRTHQWPSRLSQLRPSKAPLAIVATDWEAVWEAKQMGAHFFVHSVTGHTQWKAPPHDSSYPVIREGGQCCRPAPSSEQHADNPRVHPTCERVHSIPARRDQVERRPLNNKRARKNARSNETDWSRVSWSDL